MRVLLSLMAIIMASSAFSLVPPQNRPGYCKLERSPECENFIKKRVSRWEQDDTYELNQIRYSCSGNIQSSCLQIISKNLSRFETNNLESLKSLALSCQLSNVSCLNYIKNKLSRLDKKDPQTMRELAYSCARAESSCVIQKCSNDFNCRNKEGLFRAAKSCYTLCD